MKEHDTILLADDCESDLMLMRYAFRKAGVGNQVCEVRDGQEAIDYIEGKGRFADRSSYPLPCVIITDIKMPCDGMTFLKWLHEKPEFRQVPKLVLSNSGQDVDRDQAAELGACAYFVKPSDLDELVNVVKGIDDDWISEHCPMKKSEVQ